MIQLYIQTVTQRTIVNEFINFEAG